MSENRRSRNRGGRGGRGRSRTRGRERTATAPAKKKNPIIGLLSRLFGGGSSSPRKSEGSNGNSKPANRRPKPAAEKESETMPEVNSNRLYIGNLPYETSESDLFDHFAQVGQVKAVEVVRDHNNRSKGFGFVEMNSVETAKTVSEKFHRTDFQGRQIIVAGAKN